MVELDPQTYQDFIVLEDGKKVLYLWVLKAIYGLLKSALLFYKKLQKDLENIGFEINFYNPCVANQKMVSNKLLLGMLMT